MSKVREYINILGNEFDVEPVYSLYEKSISYYKLLKSSTLESLETLFLKEEVKDNFKKYEYEIGEFQDSTFRPYFKIYDTKQRVSAEVIPDAIDESEPFLSEIYLKDKIRKAHDISEETIFNDPKIQRTF